MKTIAALTAALALGAFAVPAVAQDAPGKPAADTAAPAPAPAPAPGVDQPAENPAPSADETAEQAAAREAKLHDAHQG